MLLDLDGTLVNRDAAFARWATAFVAEKGMGETGTGETGTAAPGRRRGRVHAPA